MISGRPFDAESFIQFGDKKIMYLNNDSPAEAYDTEELCFVAQPTMDKRMNKKLNVVPIPLMMTDEVGTSRMPSIIDHVFRDAEKKFDYMFIGQCHYAGREVFRTLNLDNYDFEETKPIYDLQGEEKQTKLLDFLTALSQSKFVFAPRGIGSSSFRAYQAMMVGSVPIITGMMDYPFEDEVNWDSFSIRGDIEDLVHSRQGENRASVMRNGLINKSKMLSDDEYNTMRNNGMQFWDSYCKHDALYDRLHKIYQDTIAHTEEEGWGLGAD